MAFEFVDMDLDERYRLRKLLLELGGLPMVAQVTNRTRRRGARGDLEELDPARFDFFHDGEHPLPTCPLLPLTRPLVRGPGRPNDGLTSRTHGTAVPLRGQSLTLRY